MIFESLGRAAAQTLASRGDLRPYPAAKAFEEILNDNLEAGAIRFAKLALAEKGKEKPGLSNTCSTPTSKFRHCCPIPTYPLLSRQELSGEFAEIEAISEKLQHSEIHIAAFGRVGTGKSSLLNALLGREVFSTSPLHGETRSQQRSELGLVQYRPRCV